MRDVGVNCEGNQCALAQKHKMKISATARMGTPGNEKSKSWRHLDGYSLSCPFLFCWYHTPSCCFSSSPLLPLLPLPAPAPLPARAYPLLPSPTRHQLHQTHTAHPTKTTIATISPFNEATCHRATTSTVRRRRHSYTYARLLYTMHKKSRVLAACTQEYGGFHCSSAGSRILLPFVRDVGRGGPHCAALLSYQQLYPTSLSVLSSSHLASKPSVVPNACLILPYLCQCPTLTVSSIQNVQNIQSVPNVR